MILTARRHAASLFPGLMASATVGAAASFLSQHYGAPVMLFALLLGMSMNFLSDNGPCAPGIEFAARQLLRVGVALLGLRITYGQIAQIGLAPVLLVMASVVATMAFGVVMARLLGFRAPFGLLTGGAVGICGASAALALSTVLPAHPLKERATLFTVIGVSALSTLAMVLYPMASHWLGLQDQATGIFLGATIHDVAQVVGAGYGVSNSAGDTATVVKLVRVAMLVPVMLVLATWVRAQARSAAASRAEGAEGAAAEGGEGAERAPLLPWFVIAFAAFVVVGSLGWVPAPVAAWGGEASRACLVVAISAIGLKTRMQEMASVGPRPIVLMVAETLFLAVLVAVVLRW